MPLTDDDANVSVPPCEKDTRTRGREGKRVCVRACVFNSATGTQNDGEMSCIAIVNQLADAHPKYARSFTCVVHPVHPVLTLCGGNDAFAHIFMCMHEPFNRIGLDVPKKKNE